MGLIESLVFQSQPWFLLKWNLLGVEFEGRAFLVNHFQKSDTLVFVDFQTRSDDSTAFLLEDYLACFHFRVFRVFRSYHARVNIGGEGRSSARTFDRLVGP